ncbi:MAG: hypothetical protein ACK2U3_04865 [Anaerolineales bacterium]
MSPTTLRIVIFLVLLAHGIGHSMAFFPAWGISSTENWHHRSWLLTPLIGDKASRVINTILFLAAFLGFIGSAIGLMGWLVPHDLWRPLAVPSAVISLAALFLFWNSFVAFFPNKIGAIAVNLAVLVCLLYLNWPTETDIGY